MSLPQNRRRVLSTLALAGAAGLIRAPLVLASEASLEITTVRLQRPGLCVAALDIAEALLRADGFTDIRYVDAIAATTPVSRGDVDFAAIYPSDAFRVIDTANAMTLLAGLLVGCFQLFARDGISTIAGLNGNIVGGQHSNAHALLSSLAAQVGLDRAKDIRWVTLRTAKLTELLMEGKIDAFPACPPEPRERPTRHF